MKGFGIGGCHRRPPDVLQRPNCNRGAVMADYIREAGDWVLITVRVPKTLWDRYEDTFPTWPLAIGAVRDHVHLALLRAAFRADVRRVQQ